MPHTPGSRRSLTGSLPTVAALAAAVLLAACGGGEQPEAAAQDQALLAQPAEPTAEATPEPDGTANRRFVLWEPGGQLALQAEQQQMDAQAQTYASLVVRLNPAAVQPMGRALVASAPMAGEAGASAAARAVAMAAKAAAVAQAADGVMARNVVPRTTAAFVRQQYSQVIEGFVLAVPWAQAQEVADALASDPAVDAVEADRQVGVVQTSSLRSLTQGVWGVDRIDQRTRAFDGRFGGSATGSGVTAYVVDTGISAHAQFGNRLVPGFTAFNDGRGTSDCHGHGTHVAGTIGGATVGVASAAKLSPVRVLGCTGSSPTSGVLAGLDWIAGNGVRPAVVNMSLGGGAFETMDNAVQRLVSLGFTVVVAAGNENTDACTKSPARARAAIAVGASNESDGKASFSNWGSCVALSAPGTSILSAGIASSTALVSMNGTSMASPHVAGTAALVLQAQPSASPAQVRQLLLTQATPNLVTGVPANTTRALLFAGDALLGAPLPVVAQLRTAELVLSTETPELGLWRARARVVVQNAEGQRVAGARVAGRFSINTTEFSCTTGSDGSCALVAPNVAWSTVTAIGFKLTALSATSAQDSGLGARDGQVARPAAPVARVLGITGSMVRTSPSATSWTPRFVPTLRDAENRAVERAVVSGTLTTYIGSRAQTPRTVQCTTDAMGVCTLSGVAVPNTHTGAVLQIGGVSRIFLVDSGQGQRRATVGQTP